MRSWRRGIRVDRRKSGIKPIAGSVWIGKSTRGLRRSFAHPKGKPPNRFSNQLSSKKARFPRRETIAHLSATSGWALNVNSAWAVAPLRCVSIRGPGAGNLVGFSKDPSAFSRMTPTVSLFIGADRVLLCDNPPDHALAVDFRVGRYGVTLCFSR
jgi:hypothetical protein